MDSLTTTRGLPAQENGARRPKSEARRREDGQIWDAFHRHSRTFSLAARLLPGAVRMPVATLYLFCRRIDSIADERVVEAGADAALSEVDAAREALLATLAGRPPNTLLWRRLAEVHAAYALAPAPLYELLDGATWDLRARAIETGADLVNYSNLVAGSVGAMMLPLLVPGAEERAKLEASARTLGIAMQITNIVRDVGEDARRLGRIYLPRAWMDECGVTPEALSRAAPGTPEGYVPAGYPALLERTMQAAELRYRRSAEGIGHLPLRARLAVRAAARMYREIMNEVRALGYANLGERAYVSYRRKLGLVVYDGYERRRARLLDGRPTMDD